MSNADKTREQLLTEIKKLEASNQQLIADEYMLGERVKELNCFYNISESVDARETLDEILQDIANIIPPAWQYPGITCAKITLQDKEFKTKNYKESKWKQSSDILVKREIAGKVEVCYLKQCPESDIGPFLKGEEYLLHSISERLGRIIERMQAEKIIRLLTMFPDENPTPVMRVDKDGLLLYANRSSTSLLTYWAASVNSKLPELWCERVTKVLEEKQAVEHEMQYEGISLSLTLFPIKNMNYVNIYAYDTTKRKQAELELIKAQKRAEESDHLKSAFLANMSHEIRTPMNGVLGFAELLKNPKLTGEQQQEYICIIEKSGARMLNIINDIVDISKIEAGLMKLNIKESNVNEQIEYIYTFFKSEVEAKGMQLFFKNTLSAKEAIINTDREKVFAILTNLVKNAIKFTENGSIELGYNLITIENTPSLKFYVKDTGMGIPEDRQEAIFERFIQADIEKGAQGSGLGLSISKAYIKMLGGEIWVESEEGVGSTFYFTLPYHAKQEEKISVENVLPSDKTVKHISNLKILIAEDDEVSA